MKLKKAGYVRCAVPNFNNGEEWQLAKGIDQYPQTWAVGYYHVTEAGKSGHGKSMEHYWEVLLIS